MKPRTAIYLFFGLLLLVVVASFFRAAEATSVFLTLPDGHRILLEVADTPEERMFGLVFHEQLPEDRGMLFIFEKGELPSVWTKQYNFPVDLLWLDEDFQLIQMKENTPPCREDRCAAYSPDHEDARYAIQISGGQIRRQGLREGHTLSVHRNAS